jgi:adenosylcobinamide kinase/adenosylcobinamide-phosphate guanylyltransferase
MIRLVIGTHGSGKSALAETLAMKTGDPFRIYLATMKVLDDEGKERVARHKRQREGKGFVTIEKEYGICDILERIEKPMETTLLLECVANLVGNEMYDNPKHRIAAEELADEIAAEIKKLSEGVHNTVLVTNEYEQDSESYDEETRLYVQLLSMVNERIAKFSDEVFDLRDLSLYEKESEV